MTTPLSQFEKPDAQPYQAKRKLFLVPSFPLGPGLPEEGQRLLERYWSEVRDHVQNLERSLGTVSHVYHEMVFEGGEEGMRFLETLSPLGYSFIQAMCKSSAELEPTEDRAMVEESTDWQRCLSVGLASEKVTKAALEGFRESTRARYEHVGARIDETLKEGESGILFIREDHQAQFGEDIQVFYVAPPALDAIKRWINDQMRSMSQPPAQDPEGGSEPGAEAEAG